MAGKSKKDRLWDLCKDFVEDNAISCPESICQCDHVISNAYDFIEDICDIVGYQERPEDEEDDDDEC